MALPYNEKEGEWGKEAERYVLQLLRERGLDASMPELSFTNSADYARYEHDLSIADEEDPNKTMIAEVKRRRKQFNTHLNYPHPTVIVDACSTYNSKVRKPFMYFIVDENLTSVFAVPGQSRKHWGKVHLFNDRKKEKEFYYTCSIEQCLSFDNAFYLVKAFLSSKKPNVST